MIQFGLQGKWGREKECRASLQLLRGDEADISEEANTIKVLQLFHTSLCFSNFVNFQQDLTNDQII